MTTPPKDIATPTKLPLKFSSYALNKCFIGFGIINGIINAIIFALLHISAPTALLEFSDIILDLSITGFILGAILFACAVPLTKHDIRAESFVEPLTFGNVNKFLPRPYLLSMLVIAIITCIIMSAIGSIAASILPTPLPMAGAAVLKGFVCTLGGAASGYLSIVFAIRAFHEKQYHHTN